MKKTYLLILTTLALLLAACGPKEELIDPTPTNVEVSGVTLNQATLALKTGETGTLTANVQPANATNKTVTWSSSNTSVATVTNGTVTAVAEGNATITASAGGKSATCQVTVSKSVVAVTSVTLNKTEAELFEEEELTLEAKVEPNEATDKDITWASSDETVVKVENGIIVAVAQGTATVTATAGGKTASCALTVKEAEYKAKERAALVAFYKANNGDNWKYNQNWLSDKPLSEWHGIKMTADGKHVSVIRLYYNNVDGYIPKEIADLTELETLWIYNQIPSADEPHPLPEAIGQLKKLKTLDLQAYSLSGTLPSSLFDLSELEKLRIVDAKHMQPSPIPEEIGKLTNLTVLDLSGINLTGIITPEIGRLTGLTSLSLFSNELTGGIPDSFGNLLNLETLDLISNQLSGEIPASFYRLKNYWKLWPGIIRQNNFSLESLQAAKIPAPKSPPIKSLSGQTLDLEKEFAKNQYTVLVNMDPDGAVPEILPGLVSLYNANKGKGLGIITYSDNNFSDWDAEQTALKKRYTETFKQVLNESGVKWESFVRYLYDDYNGQDPLYSEKGAGIYPFGSIDEIVLIGPEQTVEYTTLLDYSDGRLTRLNNFLEYLQGIYKVPIQRYESSDYSKDKEVVTLQKASVGKGVDLVITGDAFSDRLIADGTLKTAALQASEDFFSVEPYKSMRNRFNIYLVNAVSKNEEMFNGRSTAFSTGFDGTTGVFGDNKKILTYASAAVNGDEARMDEVVVLVLVNSGLSGGTAYLMDPLSKGTYAGGASVTFVPYKNVSVSGGVSRKAGVLIHESGGHGLGKLADEYSVIAFGRPKQGVIDRIKDEHKIGWSVNVDVTGDPEAVLWSRYIGDTAFADEEIGVYEGGSTYLMDVWRPTRQSVMNSNELFTYFNAPSRAQIYTRIMKLSEGQSWEFDYDAFVAWDKAHPTSTRVSTRSIVEVDDEEEFVCYPPVKVGKTWKEVIEGR